MRGYHSRLPRLGDVALWPDHRRAGAGFLVTRGGGGQTVAEHFPEREYRTGERAKAGVRCHGELIAGKLSKLRKRSGFRLSGTGPGRPLHSNRLIFSILHGRLVSMVNTRASSSQPTR
jgi:hypothetical protein